MAITVHELVELAELGTRVVAGARGLDRAIGWAHVCELRDPWEWVGRDDLLMTTGLGIPPEPAAQVEYVRRLADVGAAGVAVGENMNAPPLSEEMYAAAEERGLPLLLTRYEIPFIALARAVAEASAREDHLRIDQTVRVYELLRRSSGLDLTLEELVGSLEQVVGCTLLVADLATGRSLLRRRPVPEAVRDAVCRWAGRAGGDAPVVLHLPAGAGVAVAMPGLRPAVLVALAPEGQLPDSTVLRHMAAAAALQQTFVFAERERARRLGASLLAQLLDERLDLRAAATQLEERGLGRQPMLLVACAPGEDAEQLHLLHHALDDGEVEHLMVVRGDITVVLLNDDCRAVEALAEGLPRGSAAGISDPFEGAGALAGALRQARWALHRAQDRKMLLVRHGDDFGGSLFLPARRDDSGAAAQRVLGDLFGYDAQHASDLVRTLQVFLEENRSWQRTAARLHVHKQTLVYRIRRIEALTGRSLADTGDVAELWLGLQAAASSALLEQ